MPIIRSSKVLYYAILYYLSNGTKTGRLQISHRKNAKTLSQPHPPTRGMEKHTPHCHIKQLPNHPTTKTETANTTQNNNATLSKNTENNTKWATFTFSSPHIRKITNLFRHTNVKISYKYSNTVAQITKPASGHNIPPHNKSGVYCLTCKICNLSYVGQTSRT